MDFPLLLGFPCGGKEYTKTTDGKDERRMERSHAANDRMSGLGYPERYCVWSSNFSMMRPLFYPFHQRKGGFSHEKDLDRDSHGGKYGPVG